MKTGFVSISDQGDLWLHQVCIVVVYIFFTTIEGLGSEINPYSRCVAKKVIEGTQCCIGWYVEDNTLLYKNTEVILDIINEAKK